LSPHSTPLSSALLLLAAVVNVPKDSSDSFSWACHSVSKNRSALFCNQASKCGVPSYKGYVCKHLGSSSFCQTLEDVRCSGWHQTFAVLDALDAFEEACYPPPKLKIAKALETCSTKLTNHTMTVAANPTLSFAFSKTRGERAAPRPNRPDRTARADRPEGKRRHRQVSFQKCKITCCLLSARNFYCIGCFPATRVAIPLFKHVRALL
jgi:hypothetical protein